MVAISWKDKAKKPTNFLTNMYTGSLAVEKERRLNGAKKIDNIPMAAFLYTEMGMGCVDTFNHLLVGTTPK